MGKDGLKSVSVGASQAVLYVFAILFLLLVIAGAAALLKYLWLTLAG